MKKILAISVSVLIAIAFSLNVIKIDKLTNQTSAETSDSAFTVIVDAGHGGEDGGAIGKSGALEKDVNLQFALKDIYGKN